MTVTRLADDRFRVVTGAGTVDSDLGWLRAHIEPGDGAVSLRDASAELAVIGIWGPRARDVVAATTDDDVSNAALPFGAARSRSRSAAPRCWPSGSPTWASSATSCTCRREWAIQVWDRLRAAGAPHGLELGGYRALESLRMEKGYRYIGTDLTAGDTPYEAGLGFCVAMDKGEFIGREALASTPRRAGRGCCGRS